MNLTEVRIINFIMASNKGVIAEYRTLSPANTHDYWKELCSKEDVRAHDFKKKLKKGASYSKRDNSNVDIYNGYGKSGEKRENTLRPTEKGKYIDFSRIGRLFVVPAHKTAVHSFDADALDKTYLRETQ